LEAGIAILSSIFHEIHHLEAGIAILSSIFHDLCLIYIMFLFIMFLVCFSYMLDIVIVDTKFMHKFTKCLAQYSSELSG
jgi:hypothetical protein